MRRLSSSAAATVLAGAALVVSPGTVAADIPPASGFDYEYIVNTLSTAAPVENDGWCTLQEALDTAVKSAGFIGDCGSGAWAEGMPFGAPVRVTFAGAGRGRHLLTRELTVPAGAHVLIDGRGESAGEPHVVLDGQGVTRVLRAAGPLCTNLTLDYRKVLLRDLTITRGKVPGAPVPGCHPLFDTIGGGVVTDSGTHLIVDRVTFTDNEALGGAAVGFHGPGTISDSTLAFNLSLGEPASRTSAAVVVVHGNVTVFGSTFFHNTTAETYARDLATAPPQGLQMTNALRTGYNIHISSPGAPGSTCLWASPIFSAVDLRGLDTSANPSSCAAGMTPDAVLTPAGLNLEPLPPGTDARDALLDWGGWVQTIALAPPSQNHARGGCSVLDMFRSDTQVVLSPMREDPRGRDTRGVNRPTTACDWGALERDVQTIDFPQPASGTAVVGSTLLTPAASSGAPVTLSAGPEAVCSVTASGVRLHAAGECTATAEQAGNALYRPASVARTFTVIEPLPQTITFTPPAPQGLVGTPLTLTATGGGSGNPVTLLVPPPTKKGAKAIVCTLTPLSSTGATTEVTVSFLNSGTCWVEALQDGSALYAPATALLAIPVQAPSKGKGPNK